MRADPIFFFFFLKQTLEQQSPTFNLTDLQLVAAALEGVDFVLFGVGRQSTHWVQAISSAFSSVCGFQHHKLACPGISNARLSPGFEVVHASI